jgi:hypothetical protein
VAYAFVQFSSDAGTISSTAAGNCLVCALTNSGGGARLIDLGAGSVLLPEQPRRDHISYAKLVRRDARRSRVSVRGVFGSRGISISGLCAPAAGVARNRNGRGYQRNCQSFSGRKGARRFQCRPRAVHHHQRRHRIRFSRHRGRGAVGGPGRIRCWQFCCAVHWRGGPSRSPHMAVGPSRT